MIFFSILFFLSLTGFAQNSKKEAKKKEKQEQYELVLALVQSGEFEFIGQKASTQKGRQIDLGTRSNFLRISNGEAIADMPYFGRAYSAGYSSSDGGVKFDSPMEDYNLDQNDKKKKLTIRFKARSADDSFSCILSIAGVNGVSLSVSSNKKQGIRYTGAIRELQDKE